MRADRMAGPLVRPVRRGFPQVLPEVIQLTARVNQKYFVCCDGSKLANAFVRQHRRDRRREDRRGQP